MLIVLLQVVSRLKRTRTNNVRNPITVISLPSACCFCNVLTRYCCCSFFGLPFSGDQHLPEPHAVIQDLVQASHQHPGHNDPGDVLAVLGRGSPKGECCSAGGPLKIHGDVLDCRTFSGDNACLAQHTERKRNGQDCCQPSATSLRRAPKLYDNSATSRIRHWQQTEYHSRVIPAPSGAPRPRNAYRATRNHACCCRPRGQRCFPFRLYRYAGQCCPGHRIHHNVDTVFLLCQSHFQGSKDPKARPDGSSRRSTSVILLGRCAFGRYRRCCSARRRR